MLAQNFISFLSSFFLGCNFFGNHVDGWLGCIVIARNETLKISNSKCSIEGIF